MGLVVRVRLERALVLKWHCASCGDGPHGKVGRCGLVLGILLGGGDCVGEAGRAGLLGSYGVSMTAPSGIAVLGWWQGRVTCKCGGLSG